MNDIFIAVLILSFFSGYAGEGTIKIIQSNGDLAFPSSVEGCVLMNFQILILNTEERK